MFKRKMLPLISIYITNQMNFKGLLLSAMCIASLSAFAQKNNKVVLGKLQTGAIFSFVKTPEGLWGIETYDSNAPKIKQFKTVRIEVCQKDDSIQNLSSGYKTIKQTSSGIEAYAEIQFKKDASFQITDQWNLSGSVVSVKRNVEIKGSAAGGFNSSVVLEIEPSVNWSDINCLAPGALYGDPTYDGERSVGGTLNYAAKRFVMREDILPAPMFALSFKNGTSVALLDPAPRCETTVDETRLAKDIMTDARFLFGSLGAWQSENKPIEFGFIFPATSTMYAFGANAPAQQRWIRRYHPISQDTKHNYEVKFRFEKDETFSEVTRNTWRWAWNTLNPKISYIDIEQMRRVLTDHLASQAVTIEGRTGIPFAVSVMDTAKHRQWNWTMSAMGFVGKTIECADQLLRESDRDNSERGQQMRKIGLSIISSMIQALSTLPLQGTGYDLATGKPWDHVWLAPWLRNATEDMRVLMRAYRRERALGHQHPEWFNWVKNYVDWLLLQQREDGSFPRRWNPGTNEIAEATGTTSYCPVPLLIIISEETGDPKYKQSAVRAAEFVWNNWGSRGLFIGGASDNPNITDKEAGMLSMEAFLSLYESTKEQIWLERAQVAANFTESWIWIWNVPMPLDADDANLHWKKGVPTIGLQGITAQGPGGTDEYLDWAVPSYAKLYKYTNDAHYLEVARLLLHCTKSMVAMPGRLYDMKGPGWQQENFRLGPGGQGRGVGGHRFWLPWISANHLYGITGLEEFDPELYKKLIKE